MHAHTFSTPLLWCSSPRAWSSIPVSDVAHHSAACSMRPAGMPVMPSAHFGVWSATAAAASSNPVVWSRMKSWSSQSRSMMTCSIAPSSAESEPGLSPRNRSAVRAVGVTRGSATMSFAPLSRARQIQLVVIGAHSAMFAPITNTTSASGMSLHGLLARSMPRARLLATPAETMQSRPL